MECVEFLSTIWKLVLEAWSFSTYLYMLLVLFSGIDFDPQTLLLTLQVLQMIGMTFTNILIVILICKCCKCCFGKRGKETDDKNTTVLDKVVSICGWLSFFAAVAMLYISVDLEAIDQNKRTLQRLWGTQSVLLGVQFLLRFCTCLYRSSCCSSKGNDGEKEPLLV
jgi:hypothetical protein